MDNIQYFCVESTKTFRESVTADVGRFRLVLRCADSNKHMAVSCKNWQNMKSVRKINVFSPSVICYDLSDQHMNLCNILFRSALKRLKLALCLNISHTQ